MSKDLIVAIDAGTSVIKALAFDLEGKQVAAAARPNRYDSAPGGAVEQDMARTWSDTAATLTELVERVEGLPRRIAALAITGQGDGTWLVGPDGAPAAPAWLWLDSRAAGIVAECDANGVREAIYRYTGSGMNACNQSAQLLWLERNSRDVLDRAATGQHCKDWLYLNLTGVRATDVSEGTFTFGDFRTRRYVPEILERLGLSGRRALLPEMIDGSRTTHPLQPGIAERLGLPAGVPVSLGYLDVLCTALGGGLYEPGLAVGCSIVGSTGMHMRFVPDAPALTLRNEPGGYTMPFPVPDTVAQMHSNMAATLNIDWIVEIGRQASGLLGHEVDRGEALRALDARVLDATPGAALFHPYIHEAGERGPFIDAAARAQFIGLTSRVGYLDLVRAVYEGLAMAALDCYRAMDYAPEEIRVAGGAGRSKALKTILAGVTGAPVRESTREEAGAAGAAMIAAVGIGAFPDMAAAAKTWVAPTLRDTVPPDPALTALYRELFPLYVEARRATAPVWHGLARSRGEAR
jgi:erythritol kinase (D-erythritol 1-phosphate-forming)